MFGLPKRFGKADAGGTPIEYDLIAARIAVGDLYRGDPAWCALKFTFDRARGAALHRVVRCAPFDNDVTRPA
jgi:hypothetical protein